MVLSGCCCWLWPVQVHNNWRKTKRVLESQTGTRAQQCRHIQGRATVNNPLIGDNAGTQARNASCEGRLKTRRSIIGDSLVDMSTFHHHYSQSTLITEQSTFCEVWEIQLSDRHTNFVQRTREIQLTRIAAENYLTRSEKYSFQNEREIWMRNHRNTIDWHSSSAHIHYPRSNNGKEPLWLKREGE